MGLMIRDKWKSFVKNKKNVVILLLSLLVAIKIPQGGFRLILWILGGVSTCCLVDILLNRVIRKKKISLQSAIISGFIVSGILDYSLDWYLLVVFSAIAIASKFLIRIDNKHVFNPANFALLIAALFRQPLTWNIESNTYLIIIAGIYLAVTLKKWPHVLGFLLVFSSTFYFSGVNPLNMISYFFLFIMLIEPKTSGFGKGRGFAFGSIAGLMSFVMFKCMAQIDIFVSSLIVANIFNALWIKKGQKNVLKSCH
ncbi:MAG: RnfABCDGE type electron transport complex subunit D [Candidatus Aadella gelida]|nr:RnfABCDGE type electron transport complex subunit D [Candidatus Aadella gelida]